MKISSDSFQDGQGIPGEFAFATPHSVDHIALSQNRSPHLTWTDVPEGTQSFVIVCHDPDVPSRADDVNQEGRQVPADLPRVDFFHWILIDIPAATREIVAGSHSQRVTPRGKPSSAPVSGLRHGLNDYTAWFSTNDQMRGDYYGYDGPCPPWNDTLIHRYIFTIYALAVPTLDIDGPLNGPSVRKALVNAPVLGQADLTGLYTLNPDLIGT
jgi:Raf kinase inhibitor-like YbhB/YbcL family protein